MIEMRMRNTNDLEARMLQLQRDVEALRQEFRELQRRVSNGLERCVDAANRGTFALLERVEKLEQQLRKPQ